ncbi:hypothetical protein GCM10011511_40180 [Puia dinghuensis]|uniref:Uncharacterized protein n=1 Tax=Puia dinghuensis TaxID=1792502 RepID=A0A8J2UG26_9BACT|nr:hypothetical protein GCM10011511_40180 [Puia dinghuensis]
MNDTPQNIKDLQLKIWLSKPPMERLRQMMENNAMLHQFWSKAQRHNSHDKRPSAQTPDKS